MNFEGCGRKRSWLHLSLTLAFAWIIGKELRKLVRTASGPAEARTGNLLNTNRWCCCLGQPSPPILLFFFLLSFSVLIGWQLSIWNCCKPFFSLLYNCQLLCFWRPALNIVVEVFPRHFSPIFLLQGCLLQTRYAQLYAISRSGVYYYLKFLKVIFLLSFFEKAHLSLFCPFYF